jgi:hypothetical protein
MDSGRLIATIIQGLIGCAIVYLVLNFFRQKKKDSVFDEIKSIEAKMANMRLILKAKVKKKSHFFRATSPVHIKTGDPFDIAATELSDLAFESNTEFEKYFVLSKQLNTYIKITAMKKQNEKALDPTVGTAAVDLKSVVDTSKPKENPEFMTTDIKNEFTIIKIIHEMIIVSKVLKKKIEEFNYTHPKKPIHIPEVIQFTSVTELKKIFSTQTPALVKTEETAA